MSNNANESLLKQAQERVKKNIKNLMKKKKLEHVAQLQKALEKKGKEN
jgi:chemotaxis methyl-accepting protein methylase